MRRTTREPRWPSTDASLPNARRTAGPTPLQGRRRPTQRADVRFRPRVHLFHCCRLGLFGRMPNRGLRCRRTKGGVSGHRRVPAPETTPPGETPKRLLAPDAAQQ
eukprot:scaffold11986_cov127-Isochrysis_galbana.AAC.5